MDDEATRLLREIKELLVASAARDEAMNGEMRQSMKRGRNLMRLVLLPIGIAALVMVLWGFLSAVSNYDHDMQEYQRQTRQASESH